MQAVSSLDAHRQRSSAAASSRSATALARTVLWLGASLAFATGLYRLRTFDTFFHLATGRLIVETGAVPAGDPFSFTFPDAPWRNHSWGYQVLLERLHALGGYPAISLLQGALALAIFGLVVWHVTRKAPELAPWAAVLSVMPMVAHREVLEARPHVVGFLLLAGALVLVERARERSVVALALVPLHAAWATLHASHVLVLVLVAVAGLEAACMRRWRAVEIWAAVAVCASATTAWLAPYTFDVSGEHLLSDFMGSTVKEWLPVTSLYLTEYWPGRAFVAIVALALAGLVFAHKGEEVADVDVPRGFVPAALLLLFLAIGYTSLRMLALFMIAAQPLWVPYAALVLRTLTVRVRHVELVAPAAALLGLAALVADTSEFQPGAGLDTGRFPVAAVQHMRERGHIKRVYNAFNFGGYLAWERVPVFVDGRAVTVYPNKFLAAHDSAYANPVAFEELASRYAADGVLLPVTSPRVQQLRQYLATSERWTRTHQDTVAEVFELRH